MMVLRETPVHLLSYCRVSRGKYSLWPVDDSYICNMHWQTMNSLLDRPQYQYQCINQFQYLLWLAEWKAPSCCHHNSNRILRLLLAVSSLQLYSYYLWVQSMVLLCIQGGGTRTGRVWYANTANTAIMENCLHHNNVILPYFFFKCMRIERNATNVRV